MRIITGSARGVRLETLDGDNTRPTSERAKEAVFSILQFEMEGRAVLDLFGGSGQLGLEALSRGAASAVISDNSKSAVAVIAKNAEKTRLADKCRIITGDWSETLARLKGSKFDIVFIDPPYAEHLVPTVISRLIPLLKPTSVVVCESGEEDIFGKSGADGLYEIRKKSKYGVAYVTVLTPKER